MNNASNKLYVNLSASQVRKRLKGRGFGVRSVESSGRNQAVLHHTATGDHLRELERLFADAGTSASMSALDVPVENLKNLGPSSAAWLKEIGVRTQADLRSYGAVLAYRLIKQRNPGASLNLLWAMAAALSDRDWRELAEVEKQQLLAKLEE